MSFDTNNINNMSNSDSNWNENGTENKNLEKQGKTSNGHSVDPKPTDSSNKSRSGSIIKKLFTEVTTAMDQVGKKMADKINKLTNLTMTPLDKKIKALQDQVRANDDEADQINSQITALKAANRPVPKILEKHKASLDNKRATLMNELKANMTAMDSFSNLINERGRLGHLGNLGNLGDLGKPVNGLKGGTQQVKDAERVAEIFKEVKSEDRSKVTSKMKTALSEGDRATKTSQGGHVKRTPQSGQLENNLINGALKAMVQLEPYTPIGSIRAQQEKKLGTIEDQIVETPDGSKRMKLLKELHKLTKEIIKIAQNAEQIESKVHKFEEAESLKQSAMILIAGRQKYLEEKLRHMAK
jgi:hypothetical protein